MRNCIRIVICIFVATLIPFVASCGEMSASVDAERNEYYSADGVGESSVGNETDFDDIGTIDTHLEFSTIEEANKYSNFYIKQLSLLPIDTDLVEVHINTGCKNTLPHAVVWYSIGSISDQLYQINLSQRYIRDDFDISASDFEVSGFMYTAYLTIGLDVEQIEVSGFSAIISGRCLAILRDENPYSDVVNILIEWLNTDSNIQYSLYVFAPSYLVDMDFIISMAESLV